MGHTDKDVCVLTGISRETFYQWIKTDADFSDRVNKARIFAKDRSIKIIHNAAIKTWTAAAWYLERRYKDEFSIKQIHEHETPIPVSLSDKAEKLAQEFEDEEV